MQIIADLRTNLVKQGNKYPNSIDVVVDETEMGGVPCFWVKTSGAVTNKVILYLHGGSNVLGSIESHQNIVTRIVDRTGVQALFVEYSLAPEYPFPHSLQEIVRVYAQVLEQFDAQNIVIMGDSAGGLQGLALLLQLKEDNTLLPAGYVGLSPAVDLSPDTLRDNIEKIEGKDAILTDADEVIAFLSLYYGKDDPKNPKISPIYGDLSGLPSMLIQVSSSEALVFQCRDFVEKAKKSNVDIMLEEYPEMMHVWQFYTPETPEAQQAFDSIARFTKARLDI